MKAQYEIWVSNHPTRGWSLDSNVVDLSFAEARCKTLAEAGFFYEIVAMKDKSLVKTNVE